MKYNFENCKNDYESIISKFVMDDKPIEQFDPFSERFEALIEYALKKSFADFNFRTLKQQKDKEGKNKIDTLKKKREKVTDFLIGKLKESGFLKRFENYFKEEPLSELAFDTWHNETCEKFLTTIRNLEIYTTIEYGKAQKIVNMMFKHLYCLKGASNYQDYFEHCHFVLDNFTLEWFKRYVENKRIDSWSNLVYINPSKNKNDYLYYVGKIRNYFKNEDTKKLTPFQAEFYIWSDMQLQMSAEAFYFTLNDNMENEDRDRFREMSSAEKVGEIQKKIIELYK